MIARLRNKLTRTGLYILAPLLRYLNQLPYDFPADPKAVLKIKPTDIDFFLEDNIARQKSIPGMIVNREWESSLTPARNMFCISLKNKGLREHFEAGVPWVETSLFQERYAPLLRDGRTIRGCRTLSQLAAYYQKYDQIFEQIRKHGISADENARHIDPIYIHIGPKGELIFTSNGNHRLYMAVILSLPEIPVKVWWRHHCWQKKRDRCFRIGNDQFFAENPSLKGHPDLNDIKDD